MVAWHGVPLEFGHSVFNALAVRCVPEGRLESKPAIYRRYWCLEIDLVPEGRSKLGLAIAVTFSSLNVHFIFSTKNRQPLLVEHHRLRSFQEEYVSFLKKYGIGFEERYLWN
jgi:hypothetical protein